MDVQFATAIATVAASLITVWLLSKISAAVTYQWKLRQYHAQEPPKYPNRDPFLGLDYFKSFIAAYQSSTFLDFVFANFLKYGWTFQVNELGKTCIKTTDPAISKAFHATNFNDLGIEPLRWDSGLAFFGPGITIADGAMWHTRRAWLRPSFERVHIANFERLRRHSERFMAALPGDGSTVDLAPLFSRLNLDTSSEFIFGKSLDSLKDPAHAEKFLRAFTYAVKGVAIKYMLGKWLQFLHRDKAFAEARDEVYKHVDICVDEALIRREKRLAAEKDGAARSETDDRLRLVDELAMETQDRLDLRYQVIAVFNPAHKQTSVGITNVFFLLARHPKVYEQLRSEILPTANQPLSHPLLKSYKLVQNTIKETHRLLTISTFNARQALRDFVIPTGGGNDGTAPLYVRKGTVIEVNYRAMHRRPDIWGADAEEFRPERWQDIRPGFAYTPFGGGPRVCIGQELVNTEIAFMLVTMLREFKSVEQRDPEDKWVEEMQMAFESKNGAIVALHRA